MAYKEQRNRSAVFKVSMTALVKLLILNMLSQGKLYGNKIIDNISYTLNEKWTPSPGMIYPLLRQLENEGYISGEWTDAVKRTTRYYSITNTGSEYLNILKNNYKTSIQESIDILQSIIKSVYT